MTFCSDVDLLYWEPSLFKDALFASQLLLSGTGDLSGTAFTISSGSLIDARIEPGHVVVLSGAVTGCFPIISVDSATQLTLSVLYEKLYPDSGGPDPVAPPAAAGLSCAIRTFGPQRQITSDILANAAGIGPGTRRPDATIVNPQALKRACILGTLQAVYNALSAASGDPSALLVRSQLYQRLYRRAVERAQVEIDTNADGEADLAVALGAGLLRRY